MGKAPPHTPPCVSPQNVRIDPNSLSFGMWKEIPVPFYLSVYFFEVVNPSEILNGQKPVVRERGPYVYRWVGCGCGGWGVSYAEPWQLVAPETEVGGHSG